MSTVNIEEYNEEEADNFACAMAQKIKIQALNKGITEAEAQQRGQEKYEEVRKRHALEFLKKMEEKLDSLSDQTIAILLKTLIALGLDIEDEEELEYWISKLTHESLNRIALYFSQRDTISLWRQINTLPKTQKVLYNLKNYSNKEIEALSLIIKSLKKLNSKKSKSKESKEYRKDILDKINKTLEKDLKLRREQQRQNKQNRSRQQVQEESKQTDDALGILTGKMTSEGVEVGGRYWNEVISDFNKSSDKNNFAQTWQIDNNLRNDLDIRAENDKKQEEENNLREENQRQEDFRRQQEQENIDNLKKEQENLIQQEQELINRKVKTDERNREIEKILEKRGVKEGKTEEKSNQNQKNSQQQNSPNSARANSGGNAR